MIRLKVKSNTSITKYRWQAENDLEYQNGVWWPKQRACVPVHRAEDSWRTCDKDQQVAGHVVELGIKYRKKVWQASEKKKWRWHSRYRVTWKYDFFASILLLRRLIYKRASYFSSKRWHIRFFSADNHRIKEENTWNRVEGEGKCLGATRFSQKIEERLFWTDWGN